MPHHYRRRKGLQASSDDPYQSKRDEASGDRCVCERVSHSDVTMVSRSPWAKHGCDGGRACDQTREPRGAGAGNSFCVPRNSEYAGSVIGRLARRVVAETGRVVGGTWRLYVGLKRWAGWHGKEIVWWC